MDRQIVYDEFKRAFNYWSSVSPLKFKRVNGKADINVAFYRGRHGDSDPFGNLILNIYLICFFNYFFKNLF